MEAIIANDPVLNQVLRVNQFDYSMMSNQIEIYQSCFLIALDRYLNQKYK